MPLLRAIKTEQVHDNMAGNNNNRGGNRATGGGGAKKKKTKRGGGSRGGGAPSAVGTGYIAQGPAIVRSVGQTAKFSNTEFVADVGAPAVGSTGPVLSININPANPAFCAWLSRIAPGYELYRFRRLSVTYTPTCSSSTSGMVVMAIDHDASDAPPTTKQGISAYEGAVRGNVWNKTTLRINPMAGWYYVGVPAASAATIPAATDIKMYDMGKLYVGVFNQTGAMAVGEISIDYDVEFAKPDFNVPPALSERIETTGSAIATLAGSNAAVTGSQVFSISSPQAGQMLLTANVGGDYMLTLIGSFSLGSTLTTSCVFNNAAQVDPGQSGPATSVPWLEYVNTGTTSTLNTVLYYLNVIVVTVLAGTTLTITVGNPVTALDMRRMRVSYYRRTLQ